MANVLPPDDIRELRQSITIAKEDRILFINKLGESMYQRYLKGEKTAEEIEDFAKEILLRDQIIYSFSNELIKRTAKQGNCSNCQQPILKEVKFCGKCGTLNAFYEDKQIVMGECAVCESNIPPDTHFCPCCGVKQEG